MECSNEEVFLSAEWATSNGLVTFLLSAKIMELPPSRPAASDSPPDYRILFSSPYRGAKKKSHPNGWLFFFGDLERTRTVDLQRDRLAC